MTDYAEMTDPATEMYELAEMIRHHPGIPSTQPQYDALASLFGTEVGSDDYFTLMAAVRRRIADFEAQVKASPKLRPRPRDSALAALASIATVLSPRCGHEIWNQLAAQRITEAHITALVGLEQYFADAHPMQRLTNTDRQALVAEMDALLAVLASGRLDLDTLLIDAVSKAFRDLRLVLERFSFFGRRAVEEKLVIVASALRVAGNAAGTRASAETTSFIERAITVVKTIVSVVVVVGGVQQGAVVIGDGIGWVAKQAIEQIGAQRLLTDQSQGGKPPEGDEGEMTPADAIAAPIGT
ncbi:hypothetical protein VH569_33755 [Azospirillum sp. 11R-A]|uniref:hypothetical protein n=1 Tax=Azospirillum sp. 11R-A TaxID=3111634 RepID=UPI003C14B926